MIVRRRSARMRVTAECNWHAYLAVSVIHRALRLCPRWLQAKAKCRRHDHLFDHHCLSRIDSRADVRWVLLTVPLIPEKQMTWNHCWHSWFAAGLTLGLLSISKTDLEVLVLLVNRANGFHCMGMSCLYFACAFQCCLLTGPYVLLFF